MDSWLTAFDRALLRYFAIDHVDAGLDEHAIFRYRDLPAEEAALVFGEDYDLTRVDAGWM